eukprot:scaffold83615_cov24-Phaeocystis_antarctica.AAC.1
MLELRASLEATRAAAAAAQAEADERGAAMAELREAHDDATRRAADVTKQAAALHPNLHP